MDADRWERKRQRWERRWERRRARMHSPGKHLFSGFLFVVLGVVFLLGNMGYLDVEQALRFWPLILIGFGVVRLVEARDDYAQSGGMFWIVVGLLFLLGSFGIIRMAIRDLWPVLLIGIGVLMLWRAMLNKRERENLASASATAASASARRPVTVMLRSVREPERAPAARRPARCPPRRNGRAGRLRRSRPDGRPDRTGRRSAGAPRDRAAPG